MSPFQSRIFISCVSAEFRTQRERVANAVRHIGCEPVTMDNWSTADGELVEWHRKQIDICEGLIQIVGIAYGGEPSRHDPVGHGIPDGPARYSYTQWEFYYARAAGKKTWVIQLGEDCTRETPTELLDLPNYPGGVPAFTLLGAQDYQLERRKLQASYLQRLKDENQVRHCPSNNEELEILILKLRDLPTEARANFQRWQDVVGDQLDRAERNTEEILSSQRRLEEMVKQLTLQRRDHFREAAQQGAEVKKIPQEELEAELSRRMGISPAELCEIIAAGLESKDSLVRGRGEVLAGKWDAAIASASEVKKRNGGAVRELIAADELFAQAHYAKAEFELALAARQRVVSLISREAEPGAWADAQLWVADVLHNLGRYPEEVIILREVIAVTKRELGPDLPVVFIASNNLATALAAWGKIIEAKELIHEILRSALTTLGPENPVVVSLSIGLGGALLNQGKFGEAEEIGRLALEVIKKNGGEDHPHMVTALNNLAVSLRKQGRAAEAEPLCRRIIGLIEGGREYNSGDATILNNFACVLRAQDKQVEAEEWCRFALEVGEKGGDREHPEIARILNNLGSLLAHRGRLAEAEGLLRRAIGIADAKLNEDHPEVAIWLDTLADILMRREKFSEAERLIRQSIEICERNEGVSSPNVASGLCKLGVLLYRKGKPRETVKLFRRTLLIAFQYRSQYGTSLDIEALMIEQYSSLLSGMGSNFQQIGAEIQRLKIESGLAYPPD